MTNYKKCDCDNQADNSSGFMFGLILGAIIGAIIAVLIYKHNKGQVIKVLQSKFESFFKPDENIKQKSSAKISVVLPPKVVQNSTSVKTSPVKKNKMFVKPKK
jgi:gas vesicle protein